MPTPRFYYKEEKNKDGLALVYMRYYCKPRQLSLSSGIHVRPVDWNGKTQRVRKSDPDADSKNQILDDLSQQVQSAALSLRAAKKPLTPESLRAVIEKTGTSAQGGKDVADFAAKEFADKGSAGVYSNLAKQIIAFIRSNRRGRTFEEIDPQWFRDFRQFLTKKQQLSDSYAARTLTALKTVIKQAALFGYTQNTSALLMPIEVSTEASSAVIFTLTEINQLLSVELYDHELERVRDCFVCACLTGLRHSDWHKLTLEASSIIDANGRKFCRIATEKTGVFVHSPLFAPVVDILKKYGGKLPVEAPAKTITALREVCELAGFTDTVTKYTRRGMTQQSHNSPRFEQVGTHTGRRSFISACRGVGMPDNLIGEMSGHNKSQSMADLYDRRAFEQKAAQMEPYLQKIEGEFPSTYNIRFI